MNCHRGEVWKPVRCRDGALGARQGSPFAVVGGGMPIMKLFEVQTARLLRDIAGRERARRQIGMVGLGMRVVLGSGSGAVDDAAADDVMR